jgi:hypothetical protein
MRGHREEGSATPIVDLRSEMSPYAGSQGALIPYCLGRKVSCGTNHFSSVRAARSPTLSAFGQCVVMDRLDSIVTVAKLSDLTSQVRKIAHAIKLLLSRVLTVIVVPGIVGVAGGKI